MPLLSSPHPHVMNSLNGPTAPKVSFLVFYSSVDETGKMWCPDCRDVEDVVKQTFDGEDKPTIIYWVGQKPEWRTPENEARKHWNVNSVPTILRIENGKETARLVEDEILDGDKLAGLVA